MSSYVGLDWSGSPHPKEKNIGLDLYVPCCICVSDQEAVDEYFQKLRKDLMLAADYEFHGYECKKKSLVKALTKLVEYALNNAYTSAIIFDKQTLINDLGTSVFDKPILLPPATGKIVLYRMLEITPIKQVFCDEDIAPSHQPAFNTAIQRKARLHWPISPKFKHHPSHKWNLIQLADVVAYALQRHAHGLSETTEIDNLVNAIWKKPENQLMWGKGNDLQPYL